MNKAKVLSRVRRAEEIAGRSLDLLKQLRVDVPAICDVLYERSRQVSEFDDSRYQDGDLTLAAVAYALFAPGDPCNSVAFYPWGASTFKPRDRRCNLVRAAALLIAELERFDESGESNAYDQSETSAD